MSEQCFIDQHVFYTTHSYKRESDTLIKETKLPNHITTVNLRFPAVV